MQYVDVYAFFNDVKLFTLTISEPVNIFRFVISLNSNFELSIDVVKCVAPAHLINQDSLALLEQTICIKTQTFQLMYLVG